MVGAGVLGLPYAMAQLGWSVLQLSPYILLLSLSRSLSLIGVSLKFKLYEISGVLE